MKLLDILPQQPTWEVIDSSKLGTYMSCPRKYFYEYVLGWRPDTVNNHLHFGTCWHSAVEHLLKHGHSKDRVEEAQYLFFQSYRLLLDSETDGQYAPKDPANGVAALEQYAQRFAGDHQRYTVLDTEIGGIVLLAPDAPMTFKLDALLENKREGTVLYLDHKTSQRRMSFWNEQWQMSTQMLTYLHVLYCLYGMSAKVHGGKVRCTFFYKSRPNEFEEADVIKSPAQMNAWLASTHAWYTMLQNDMQILTTIDDTQNNVLQAFPMNEKACFDYGRQCSYFDFCMAWANPLHRCEHVPLGMKKEFWDPREEQVNRYIDLTGGDNGKLTT